MARALALLGLFFIIVGLRSVPKPTVYSFPELGFFPPMPLAEGNQVTVEGAQLGRFLFYDPILSSDKNISCASCHRQQAAFSDAPHRFSQGFDNALTERNTLPLFNLAWYPSFFWDGRASSIEEQVFHPVRAHTEMNLQWTKAVKRLQRDRFYRSKFATAFGPVNIDSIYVSKAIGQFLRTLISHNSRYDSALKGKVVFTKDEFEGFELFNDMTKGDCLHCHTTDQDALGTTLTFSNNGLDKVSEAEDYLDKGRGAVTGSLAEYGQFKIPSLRNIALTAPYMHDGRFKTLEEVLDFYSEGVNVSANVDSKMGAAHRGGVRLTKEEKRKIIVFLHTLTDSTFITDQSFSDPFTSELPVR